MMVGVCRLVELPLDVDLALREIGEGLEGTDREVDRLSVTSTGGAGVGDLSNNSLAVGGVLDGDPSTTGGVALRVVGVPVRASLQGNKLVRVRLVPSTGTGVTVLVEVGG